MRLLYDLTATQPSPESKFHGGGAYGEVVFFKMLEYLDKFQMYCIYNAKSYINPGILKAIEQYKIPLFDINEISVESVIKANSIDRAYSAMLNLNQNWPIDDVKIYTTVHGLRTIEMPFDKTMLFYEHSIKQKIKDILFMTLAKKIYLKKMHDINGRIVRDKRIKTITISNHSLAAIRAFYPETKEYDIPVFLTPLPPPPSFIHTEQYLNQKDINDLNESLEKLGISEKKYFLLTSAARWIKNTVRAVKAFDEFFSSEKEFSYKVVITGVTNKKIFTKNLKNPNNFIFLDYVDRPLLQALNKKQYAFIYPSLNEGFGAPPLEAMQYGIPVAASGTSAIPETCGDAALYFDPYSVSEIKNRIIQLLNPSIYKDFSEKSIGRYKYIAKRQEQDLSGLVEYILK
ncbi:MAG: glycosyltransferase [Treponema sp.]|nr:glycosyltransferase [Treponema sp.]